MVCSRSRGVSEGTYHLVIVHARYGTVADLPELDVTVAASATAVVDVRLKSQSPAESREEADNEAGSPYASGQSTLAPRIQGITGTLSEAEVQGGSHLRRADKSIVDESGSTREYGKKAGRIGIPVPSPPGRDDYCSDGSLPPVDMFFKDYGTNGFVSTRSDRFSTFALDVDDASYTLVRRYLQEGNVPPADAIRVEEFINHFDYGYANPDESAFRVFAEMTDSPFDRETVLLKVGIKGREIERSERRNMNVTLVVDVSGSMRHGNRIALVRESIQMLTGQLGRNDRVGIVAYNTSAWVALEPVQGDHRRVIERAIARLNPGGSTNAEAGLNIGYDMANRMHDPDETNLVVLLSDGVANVGNTGADGIMGRIERFAGSGITLNTYGVGMGNYNDVLLEQLAQRGNGRYAYMNDREEARQAMVTDFVANTQILGRDAKVQVAFNEKLVRAYRLIGYENRDVADYRFRDNNQDGGEIGAGHEVTALYELKLKGQYRGGNVAEVFVRWKNFGESQVTEVARTVSLKDSFVPLRKAHAELRLAAVASRFAEMLKGTPYTARMGYDELLQQATQVHRDLGQDQTRELVDLIRRARDLTTYHTDYDYQPYDDDAGYRAEKKTPREQNYKR